MAWELTPWRPFKELTPSRDFERMRRDMDHLWDSFFERRPRRREEEMESGLKDLDKAAKDIPSLL